MLFYTINFIDLLKKKQLKDLNINIWNVIILLGIIQGIVFGILVLTNKKYRSTTNSFLAYTAFSMSFSNLQYWFLDSNLSDKFAFLSIIRIPFEFLIIPMFYIFVDHFLNLRTSSKVKLAILIPFFLDLICQIIRTINKVFFRNKLIKIELIDSYLTIEEIFSFSFSTILIFIILNRIKKFEFNNNKFDIENVVAKTRWLKQILFVGLITCAIWVSGIYLMRNITISDETSQEIDTSIYYPIWIGISIIIYWLSYVGLIQSNIFNERKIIRKDILLDSLIDISLKTYPVIKSQFVEKSINPITQETIFKEFEDIILQSYMNPNLGLSDVAKILNISNNYLSQIISSKKTSFNDYLNSIRVEKVKIMLRNNNFSKYTITSIGLEAGFNSNASFYRAFKKHTGSSPSVYRTLN